MVCLDSKAILPSHEQSAEEQLYRDTRILVLESLREHKVQKKKFPSESQDSALLCESIKLISAGIFCTRSQVKVAYGKKIVIRETICLLGWSQFIPVVSHVFIFSVLFHFKKCPNLRVMHYFVTCL